MTTMRTAPEYLSRDTYTGRHTLRSNSVRSDAYTARELAAFGTVGEVMVLWESAGKMCYGVTLWVRSRFVPQADGSLVGYNAEGGRSIVHPADRTLRVLTK